MRSRTIQNTPLSTNNATGGRAGPFSEPCFCSGLGSLWLRVTPLFLLKHASVTGWLPKRLRQTIAKTCLFLSASEGTKPLVRVAQIRVENRGHALAVAVIFHWGKK